jgi:hypothetical protein
MLVFNNYFYKNRTSKLYFGDRVAVLNDFIYQTGGSMALEIPTAQSVRNQTDYLPRLFWGSYLRF